jgi:hypothetical protein
MYRGAPFGAADCSIRILYAAAQALGSVQSGEFITLLGGAALGWAREAHAQVS